MSSASSAVTYTSVYTDSEPWRFQLVSGEELEAPEEAPPSLDYVPGPEHPPSPNYVPGPEHPPSLVYVPDPEYLEYLVPSDAEAPMEDQPLLDDASPTTLSPGYIADSDPEEDPEEDPVDYLADGGDDDDDESSDDGDDDDDEEVDGIRLRAESPPLLLPSTFHRTDIPKAEMPPRKRACFTTPASRLEVEESSTAAAARQPWPTLEADLRYRQFHRHAAMLLDREATYARKAWTGSEDRSAAIEAHVRTLEAQVATLMAQTSSLQTQLTTAFDRIQTLEAKDPEPQDEPTEASSSCWSCIISIIKMPTKKRTTTTSTTTTPMTDAQIKALIAQGVADALAEHDADRSRNGDDSHD
ncbi:hypothetical protein Tco_0644423 [Tanacetum coccineum]